MPGLQGLQERLPGQRRHGDVQGGVLSHYYEGRLRPRSAYAFGHIDSGRGWPRMRRGWPTLATQCRCCATSPSWSAGMPQAAHAFRSLRRRPSATWFRRRRRAIAGEPRSCSGPTPSTITSCRETAQAAVEVLEAAGLRGLVPRQALCCGRPLYDFGMLDAAKRLAAADPATSASRRSRPESRSWCWSRAARRFSATSWSIFFPHDRRAQRLSRADVSAQRISGETCAGLSRRRKLQRKALRPRPLPHKALMKMTARGRARAAGPRLSSSAPAAAAWPDRSASSRSSTTSRWRRRARAAAGGARGRRIDLIIADGFSCREQIAHGTGRHAMHLAEVIQMALEGEVAGAYPERDRVCRKRQEMLHSMKKAGLGVAAVAAGAGVLWALARKR